MNKKDLGHDSAIVGSTPDAGQPQQGFKGTPGPWFIADQKFTGGALVIAHGDPDGGGDSIADVTPCGPWVSDDVALADARLIAAAPDLLEAAEQCLDDMGDTGHCVCEEAKEMLRAALAKVLGKTS